VAITKKITESIAAGLRHFRPVLVAQRDRDVSEADTVTLVKDMLSEVFGYDKYAELTSEHAIRGTFCDLAVQYDGKVQLLIEIKAIGSALQDRHVKQAIDYASNKGVDWVVLTNGIEWVLYHVLFKKPIDKEEVVRLNMLEVDPKRDEDIERLYLLTRAGITKDALTQYRDRQEATNRYVLAALLVNSDPMLSTLRREVRRISGMLIDAEEIARVLREQVIKRDVLEGDQAAEASRRVNRSSDKPLKVPRVASPTGPESPPDDTTERRDGGVGS
jgi:hypothetical protein